MTMPLSVNIVSKAFITIFELLKFLFGFLIILLILSRV